MPARCRLDTLYPNSRGKVVPSTEFLGSGPFAALSAFAEVTFFRRRIRRGDAVFRIGDPFSAIYAVRSGFLKTTNVHDTGHEQVMGFFMRGELFGLDGIGTASYNCTAVSLEDSELLVLPFSRLQDLARDNPAMQHQLHQILSREITRDHGMMMLLGTMSADVRLASFLVNLSARLTRQGYSPSDFILRMTRADIGSYLGLQLETVSRIFSQLQKSGLVRVQQKHILILDPQGMQRLLARSS
jgi:CRP/FNR family transcriptional regulator